MAFCGQCGNHSEGRWCGFCGSELPVATPRQQAPASPPAAQAPPAPSASGTPAWAWAFLAFCGAAALIGAVLLLVTKPWQATSAVTQQTETVASAPPVTQNQSAAPAPVVTVTATAAPAGDPNQGFATTPGVDSVVAQLPMTSSRTWTDPSFGFRVPVPASMWISRNGSVTTFTLDSTKLVAWGENAPKSRSSAEQDLRSRGATITTSVGGDTAYSISGYLGDDIFYQRVLSGSRSSNWIYWQYPKADKSHLDSSVTKSVNGFVPGDLTATH